MAVQCSVGVSDRHCLVSRPRRQRRRSASQRRHGTVSRQSGGAWRLLRVRQIHGHAPAAAFRARAGVAASPVDLKQFELEYQPIVDSASRRILCHEALLRWRHPMRGTIMPADFIVLAENSGLIIPVGLWVLETACTEATTWPEDIKLAVNLSALAVQPRQPSSAS